MYQSYLPLISTGHALVVSQLRGRKLWRVLPNFSRKSANTCFLVSNVDSFIPLLSTLRLLDVKMPPEEERELVPLLAVPNWHGVEPRKWPRNLADLRGPETVNNDLLYGQYGIMVSGKNAYFCHGKLYPYILHHSGPNGCSPDHQSSQFDSYGHQQAHGQKTNVCCLARGSSLETRLQKGTLSLSLSHHQLQFHILLTYPKLGTR